MNATDRQAHNSMHSSNILCDHLQRIISAKGRRSKSRTGVKEAQTERERRQQTSSKKSKWVEKRKSEIIIKSGNAIVLPGVLL